MNKKIFAVLIALMGISILGIVIVQLVWMNNAIRVKNELFDRNVNEALMSTTNRLENMEDFRMMNHFSPDDSLRMRDLVPFPPPPTPPQYPRSYQKRIIIPKVPGNPTSQQIERMIRASKNHKGFQYHFSTKGDSSNKHIEEIIVINTDSLGRNMDSAEARKLYKLDSLSRQFHQGKGAKDQLKLRFNQKTMKLRHMADKVAEEINSWDENLPPIDQVDEILKKELADRNIPIPFECGIITDSLISKKTEKADSLLLATSKYKVNLFPNDIIQKNFQLAVYFPQKDSFIYKTLNWLLIISLVFSIIVVVTFAFSIYFILKQKKISEMKSDFINNMTHEFKTPIATISVAADSIVNQKIIENPERIRYYIEMIKKENIRMNQQVEDILTIARLDKKDFEFKWEAVNLHEVIEDALQSIVLQVEKKGG
ncbi:MAG TPA: hypothetical protein DCL77_06095, partial [Prolixibacteraceae bacterium]|nr:hypothetical protein [Prolixibacteraceae bacterium]